MGHPNHNKFREYTQLDDIMDDLTGQTMEESEDDRAGTNFDNDHWVCAENIAEALVEAFNKGRIEGENNA